MSLQINIGVTPGREYLLEFVLSNLDRTLDFVNMKHETRITLFVEDDSEILNRHLNGLYDEIILWEDIPLHEKYNDLITYNDENSDWILKLDMDCLLSPGFFDFYTNYKNTDAALIGFDSVYCLDTENLRCKYIRNISAPTGIVIVNSKYTGRYFTEQSRDGVLYQRLKSMGHLCALYIGKPCIMDIKDGLNQWDYQDLGGSEFF